MPIKTILVYAPSGKSAAPALEAALKLAGPRGAHVIGLHLTPDLPVYGEFPAEIPQEVIDRLQKAGEEAAATARQAFEEAVKDSGISHEWRSFMASYLAGAALIAQQGRGADLIVCGKPGDDAGDAWSDFAEIALMRAGRPVLIVPECAAGKPIGMRPVIAWNDTREAARAAFDSLDLLAEAESVRAITLIENEEQRAAAEANGALIIATLARHGIEASLEVSYAASGATGKALLAKLVDNGCDLLILGGYSHSRFREMLFGGVSRDILRDTCVPALVSH
jgi:nucleotide-binding universal stress UspA family protein